VKIPKIAAKNSGDIEVTDHIQDMKQNIQLMNQIYKNFYALYSTKSQAKKYGQDYISIELYIEKESIKLLLAIPDYFVENVEKNLSINHIYKITSKTIVEELKQNQQKR
jgi:hypothetical protein